MKMALSFRSKHIGASGLLSSLLLDFDISIECLVRNYMNALH